MLWRQVSWHKQMEVQWYRWLCVKSHTCVIPWQRNAFPSNTREQAVNLFRSSELDIFKVSRRYFLKVRVTLQNKNPFFVSQNTLYIICCVIDLHCSWFWSSFNLRWVSKMPSLSLDLQKCFLFFQGKKGWKRESNMYFSCHADLVKYCTVLSQILLLQEKQTRLPVIFIKIKSTKLLEIIIINIILL